MSQATWTGKRTHMLPEIAAAVGFLSSLLRTRGCVSEQRLKVFSGALQEELTGEPGGPGPSPRHRGSAPLPTCPPSRWAPQRAARRSPAPWSPLPSQHCGQVLIRGDSCGTQRAQTLVLQCDSDSPGLCPARGGTCGSECGLIFLTGL